MLVNANWGERYMNDRNEYVCVRCDRVHYAYTFQLKKDGVWFKAKRETTKALTHMQFVFCEVSVGRERTNTRRSFFRFFTIVMFLFCSFQLFILDVVSRLNTQSFLGSALALFVAVVDKTNETREEKNVSTKCIIHSHIVNASSSILHVCCILH